MNSSHTHVTDLIDHQNGSWNHNLIIKIFYSGDATSRINLYGVLPNHSYHFLMESLIDNSSLKIPRDWLLI